MFMIVYPDKGDIADAAFIPNNALEYEREACWLPSHIFLLKFLPQHVFDPFSVQYCLSFKSGKNVYNKLYYSQATCKQLSNTPDFVRG